MIKVADILGQDLVNNIFVQTITNLTKDAQWRVRMGTVELLGKLSCKLGPEFYSSKFETIFMAYTTNTAASVREMGVTCSVDMGKKFGADWIVKSFIPKIVENYNADKMPFNYRITCLQSLGEMIPLLREDMISEYIVPTFVKAAGDKVPNV